MREFQMPDIHSEKSIECIIPILAVKDISVSLDYYVNALGFQKDWFYQKDAFAISGVSRDDLSIYLCQGPQGNPSTWVWIGVANVDDFYEQCKSRRARIRQAPTNYSWAYEMRVEDPDGHVLRIGSDSKANEPYND
jgi:predicted lactoylglutathione lyase